MSPAAPRNPTSTNQCSHINNFKNRIAGTLALLNKASTSLKEANAQIRARRKSRQRLLDSICGDPDRKDFANRHGKVFKWEIADLEARVVGLEESMAAWTADVRMLRTRLVRAEKDVCCCCMVL